MDEKGVVRVEIFGTSYLIRGGEDRAHVERVAAYVDGKMRELQARLSTVSGPRLAVLTSLHLADELFQARLDRDDLSSFVARRATEFAGRLDEALQEA